MKITRKELGNLIREALDSDLYVVIGNAGRGQQTLWPKSNQPGVYSKTEANRIAHEQNRDSYAGWNRIHWHVQPIYQALEYVNAGQEAHIGLSNLLSNYELDDPRDLDGDKHVDWNEMPPPKRRSGG